jgi:hypothetical protein
VAEWHTVAETVEIAQGLTRRIVESCREHGDPLPAIFRDTFLRSGQPSGWFFSPRLRKSGGKPKRLQRKSTGLKTSHYETGFVAQWRACFPRKESKRR